MHCSRSRSAHARPSSRCSVRPRFAVTAAAGVRLAMTCCSASSPRSKRYRCHHHPMQAQAMRAPQTLRSAEQKEAARVLDQGGGENHTRLGSRATLEACDRQSSARIISRGTLTCTRPALRSASAASIASIAIKRHATSSFMAALPRSRRSASRTRAPALY
jgi:hypothetical protein